MKYEINDKVTITTEGSHGFKVGDKVKITKLYENGKPPHYKAERNDGRFWFVMDSELE